jgi:hypothetical protein
MFDMIGTHCFVGLILTAAAATLPAQSGAPSNPTSAPAKEKRISLVGCIQRDAEKPEWFTLLDKTTGIRYRLAGPNVGSHVWRNVRIVGGIVPSPNIAAQAGAIDQTKAAMAYQGGNLPGTGNIGPPEFSVTRVQRVTGSCAPKSDR